MCRYKQLNISTDELNVGNKLHISSVGIFQYLALRFMKMLLSTKINFSLKILCSDNHELSILISNYFIPFSQRNNYRCFLYEY